MRPIAAATPVNQSFQVTQESQTITFAALSNRAFGSCAVHRQRDGVVRAGRQLRLDHPYRLHGLGRDGDAGGGRHLHHPGDAGGQCDLCRRRARKSKLYV